MLSAQRNIPLLCDQITSVKLLTIAKITRSFIRHKVTFSLLGICTLYYCYCQLQEYDEEYKTLIQDFLERCESNYLHFNTNKTRELVMDFRGCIEQRDTLNLDRMVRKAASSVCIALKSLTEQRAVSRVEQHH